MRMLRLCRGIFIGLVGLATPVYAQDLAWFEGRWNILYEDEVLGAVPGRAVVAMGKQGLDVRIRLRDPRNGEFHRLTAVGTRLDGEVLEVQLRGSSPASGYSEQKGTRIVRVVRAPSGKQLQARMKDASPAYAVVTRARPRFTDPQLVLRFPLAAGNREYLAAEWSYTIGRPRDMAANRAGELIDRAGKRLARGREAWVRPEPVITKVTDVDLPSPTRLAAMHTDRRLSGGKRSPTPERADLETKWGPDAYAATWLMLDGDDLPVQPQRNVVVSFTDDRVEWTGQHRVNPRSPASLEIQVLLKKGITAGFKELRVNGAAGIWSYDLEPTHVRHVRMLRSGDSPAGAEFEVANELFVGEAFQVQVEYQNEPPFTTQRFVSRPGKGEVVAFDITKVTGQPKVFRSGLLLVDGRQPERDADPNPDDSFVGRIPVPVEGGVTLQSLSIETAAPSQGRAIGRSRVVPAPASLWAEALKKANACRAAGSSPTEISNRIVVDRFNKRTLAISAQDHAAAILLRDELAAVLDQYATRELKATAVSNTTDQGRQLHALYTAWLIERLRSLGSRPAILDVEVPAPPALQAAPGSFIEMIPLHNALTAEMEARTFKLDRAKFFEYAAQAVRYARDRVSYDARNTAITTRNIGNCDVEKMLAAVRTGVGPLVSNLQAKLMRPPRGSEPRLPRWRPDTAARAHVGSVSVLAEAIKALRDYSSIDSDFAIAMATAPALGLGVVRGATWAARAVGYLAPEAGTASAGSVWASYGGTAYFVGLTATDVGVLVTDANALSRAREEVEFAEGLVGLGGNTRLLEARDTYDAREFGLALNAALVSAGAAAEGIRAAKTLGKVPVPTPASPKGTKPRPSAAPETPAPVPGPDAPVTTAGAGAGDKVPAPTQMTSAERQRRLLIDAGLAKEPNDTLLFKPSEFPDLPMKPPPEPFDIAPWRTPAEQEAYRTLISSTTAALPQVPGQTTAPALPRASDPFNEATVILTPDSPPAANPIFDEATVIMLPDSPPRANPIFDEATVIITPDPVLRPRIQRPKDPDYPKSTLEGTRPKVPDAQGPNPVPKAAPAAPSELRKSILEAQTFETIGGVNAVGGKQNCFDCALAAAQRLMGRGETFAAGNTGGIKRPSADKNINRLFQTSMQPAGTGLAGRDEIIRQLAADVRGDVVGIVTTSGTRVEAGELVGHAFNVVKREGHIFFPDAQTNRLFTGWETAGEVQWTLVGRVR